MNRTDPVVTSKHSRCDFVASTLWHNNSRRMNFSIIECQGYKSIVEISVSIKNKTPQAAKVKKLVN